MYSYFHDFYRNTSDTKLLSAIQKAINAEYSAVSCYEKLAKLAPTKEERNKIREIQKDEKRHLEEFTRIYIALAEDSPLIKSLNNVPTALSLRLKTSKKLWILT
ncbi:ferritin-like domain-containing protein [Priestia flexa]|uniref:ferritin-like domain-containing protein n=1 Tax=Priestia flexa TaxID=86664 RepID=UPI0031EF1E6B